MTHDTFNDEHTRLRLLAEAGDVEALWAWLRHCERVNALEDLALGLGRAYVQAPDTARAWLTGWHARHDPQTFPHTARALIAQNGPCEASQAAQRFALDVCALWGLCPWFVLAPPGISWIGAAPDDPYADPIERPRHRVKISHGLWVASTPVTQSQWRAVVGDNEDPSDFQGDTNPVERVTWADASRYCTLLSKALGVSTWRIGVPAAPTLWDHLSPGSVRLPTSAEWEHFTRAGCEAPLYDGGFIQNPRNRPDPGLEALAWYQENARGTTHPVAQKRPNAWGLYDTLGNVDEWVWDWSGAPYPEDDPSQPVVDPIGPLMRGPLATRTIRGGSWYDVAAHCRVSYRRGLLYLTRNRSVGFRCVLTAASQ